MAQNPSQTFGGAVHANRIALVLSMVRVGVLHSHSGWRCMALLINFVFHIVFRRLNAELVQFRL
jgi:hypothetical protein